MPFIRVNCPKNALGADQKAKLAPLLVRALIRQEIDPVTEIGTAATGFFYNAVDVHNCFPGGVLVIEIPEGSWGAGGQTIDTEKISKLIGATQGPACLAEARENATKLWATRVS